MEPLVVIVLIGLCFYFLWKTRKVIWFFILFFSAIAVLALYHFGMESLKVEYPLLGPALLALGITVAAFKFAKKRS